MNKVMNEPVVGKNYAIDAGSFLGRVVEAPLCTQDPTQIIRATGIIRAVYEHTLLIELNSGELVSAWLIKLKFLSPPRNQQ